MNLFYLSATIKRIASIAFCFFPILIFAQGTISGTLKEKETGEPVTGAIVRVDSTFFYSVSDAEGNFKISGLKGNSLTITISHISYETIKKTVTLNNAASIEMIPKLYLSEEVNILATRADNRTAFAYTDLHKYEIEKNNMGQDLPFLLNMTPSVVVTSDGGNGVGYTGIRIRGSDATRVNVTMNGIPVNDGESHLVYWVDLPDLASTSENIQIQRGLGSSTNGAGALGGSINILTTTLHANPYGTVSSSAGSFNTFKNTVQFGSGLLSNSFSMEGRLSKITSDGYIDRASSDLHSFYLCGGYYGKKNSLRAIVLSGKEKTYQAWYGVPQDSLVSNRTYNAAGSYYDSGGNLNYYANQTDNYQQDYYQLLYSNAFNPNVNINAALHYTKGKGYYEEYVTHDDFYGNGLFSTYGLPDIINGSDTIKSTDLVRQRWLDNDFYGFTFSINRSKNIFHFTLGGAGNRYNGKHYDEITWMANNSGIPPQYRYSDNDAYKNDFNVFTKFSFDITNLIIAFCDFQYRSVVYKFEGFDAELNNVQQKVSLSFFNPKGGISCQLNTRQKIYASIGLGHKEPVRDDFVQSSSISRPKPEELLDAEAGYQFTGKKITFGVNAYFMNYKDQLVLTGKINDVGSYPRQNVGKSYRSGVEFEIRWNCLSNFNVSGNLTFSRNKIQTFEQYIDSSDDKKNYKQISAIYKNTNISFSPELIAAGIVEYSPFKNAVIDFTTKYSGSQYLDNTSNKDRKIKGYLVNDLQFNYHIQTKFLKEIELKFSILNLFDQAYESNGSTYPNYYNGQFSNANYYFPQAGTNWIGGIVIKM